MEKPRENITLSSGRVIAHTRQGNGSQVATPTTGSPEMTPEEWEEYCSLVKFTTRSAHGQPCTPWARVKK